MWPIRVLTSKADAKQGGYKMNPTDPQDVALIVT